jgi:hypothetical protein
MTAQFCTYLHRRNDTGEVFYVGKGSPRRSRARTGRNSHWVHVAQKHGFTVEILARWPTEAEAFAHEVLLIDVFRQLSAPLTNKSDGGEGATGTVVGEETRRKQREYQQRRRATPGAEEKRIEAMVAALSTPQHRAKVSARMRAERGTPEARRKQSEDTRAAWADPQRRAKRIAAMKEAASRPEVKARLTQASRLRVQDPDQVARSTKHMRERNAANRKPVICTTTGQEFDSCRHAADALGLATGAVREVCLGYYTHTRGLRFAYKDQSTVAA